MKHKPVMIPTSQIYNLNRILTDDIFSYCKETKIQLNISASDHAKFFKEPDIDIINYIDRLNYNNKNCKTILCEDIENKELTYKFLEDLNMQIEFDLNQNYDDFNIYSITVKVYKPKELKKQIKLNSKVTDNIKLLQKSIVSHELPDSEIKKHFGDRFSIEKKKDRINRVEKLRNGVFCYEMHFKYRDSKQFRMYFGFSHPIQECKKNCTKCKQYSLCSIVENRTKYLIFHIGKHLPLK